MDDIATLGLRVDSKQVDRASKSLTGFSRAANQAERESKELTASTTQLATATSKLRGAAAQATAGFSAFRGIMAGTAVLATAQAMLKFAESAAKVTNTLKVAGLEGTRLTEVQSNLYRVAVQNGVGVESLSTLYGRLSLAQKELNLSSGQLTDLTTAVTVSLRAQGSSAEEASGALLQLSQALGGSVVQAEEFNSLMDGMPVLLSQVAKHVEGAAGSIGKLRQIVKDGSLSSKDFATAILASRQELEAMANLASGTVSGGLTSLNTGITALVGAMDSSTGSMTTFSGMLRSIGGAALWAAQQTDLLNSAIAGGLGIFGAPASATSLREQLATKYGIYWDPFGVAPRYDPLSSAYPGASLHPAATVDPARKAATDELRFKLTGTPVPGYTGFDEGPAFPATSLPKTGGTGATSATPSGFQIDELIDAIKQVESGGDYRARGAAGEYGAYQVMPGNIGPWSQKVLGYTLTPEQFLNSPELQDRIAEGILSEYASKFGVTGAARAWNTGQSGSSTAGNAYWAKVQAEMANGMEGVTTATQATTAATEQLVDVLAEARQHATSFIETFVTGIVDGESAVDSLSSALEQLGKSLLSSGINQLATSIATAIFPVTNQPASTAGGGIFGAIFGSATKTVSDTGTIFHTGGLITAHAGRRMSDERLVLAQTGERILSRHEGQWGATDIAHNGADYGSALSMFGKGLPGMGKGMDVAWSGGGASSQKDLFNVVFNPIINANNLPHTGMLNQIVDMLRMMLKSEMPGAIRRARQNRDI